MISARLGDKKQTRRQSMAEIQTAELGTAAPDIIFLEIFCAPELHNIYVAQYIYCSIAIARYYTSK